MTKVQMMVRQKTLATMYDVSVQTIDRWRKLGMPSYKRPGMHRRYDLDEVKAWVSRYKEGESECGSEVDKDSHIHV